MPIKVGTIVNTVNIWNTYNQKVKGYTQRRDEAQSKEEERYWQDTIDMTLLEMEQFKSMIIPDPIPSKESPYLAEGWQEQEYKVLNSKKKVDIQA